ncbi:MAG: SBBP repeat-containing protein [Acidobacteria bacterium]|nr:SBBP repeat-containing protein [Acidobacteriota bacterium]
MCKTLILLLIIAAAGQTGGRTVPSSTTHVGLPLAFALNQGHSGKAAGFIARGRNYTLTLSSTEAAFKLPGAPAVRMELSGGNADAIPEALNRLPGKISYFKGNNPHAWRKGLPTYGRIRYRNVYPGIDVVYYGDQGHLEYDFVVAPGADPGAIRLHFDGASRIGVQAAGGLEVETPTGRILHRRPVVYQTLNGVRREIADSYVLAGEKEAVFALGDYDRHLPLVIDPVLAFSSYFGDANDDRGTGVAVDKDGYAYVVGWTESPEDKSKDVFVLKIDPSGSEVVYGVMLGGSDADYAYGIAVDEAGNACVVGTTYSKDLPIANGFIGETLHTVSGYVARINASGEELTYSSYLDSEDATAIAVDSAGLIYVTGMARQDIPITSNALQRAYGGGDDAFVMKIDPNAGGTDSLLYSTYLGGSLADSGAGIAVDKDGNIYVTGKTISPDFPVANAAQGRYHDGPDAFVAKIDRRGSPLAYSTYFGTDQWDQGSGIAVDASGNAYVIGTTNSKVFPVTSNAYQ